MKMALLLMPAALSSARCTSLQPSSCRQARNGVKDLSNSKI